MRKQQVVEQREVVRRSEDAALALHWNRCVGGVRPLCVTTENTWAPSAIRVQKQGSAFLFLERFPITLYFSPTSSATAAAPIRVRPRFVPIPVCVRGERFASVFPGHRLQAANNTRWFTLIREDTRRPFHR